MMDAAPAGTQSHSWWSVVRVLSLVCATALYNSASDVVWDRLGVSDVNWDSPWKVPLLLVGTVFGCVGVVGFGIVVWGRTSLRDLGWRFDRPVRLVAVGLALAAVLIGLVAAAYRVFGGPEGLGKLAQTLASYSLGRRIFFTVMGVKIAFVEESLFRGDLIRTLTPRIGTIAAVIIAALIHAIWHRGLNPISLSMKVLVALLMGVVAVRTKSLVPSAIAHALSWAVLGSA
jgi:membrane protease YdiL (CAAX protease family)